MPELTKQQKAQVRQDAQILDRCNLYDASEQDVADLRKLLQGTPGLWQFAGDLCAAQTRAVIDGMWATPIIKESLWAGREAMRRSLGHDTSPLLEQTLIDHILLCWLRLQLAEHKYTACIKEGGTIGQGDFWERRLSAVQRRYLRAVESLARIRRMNLPTIQVNVADKQVNIA